MCTLFYATASSHSEAALHHPAFTRSAAHDVINVTFIYSGRWVGAGWTTPLDDFIKDRGDPDAALHAGLDR
jgi:hypothetical protein